MAHAQEKPADYPKKPIRIVIGIAPGGGHNSMARLGAQKLSERWGQSVIVDNRPGGGTVIGMDTVARAPPDGYTLLSASDTLMLNGVLKRAPYDVRNGNDEDPRCRGLRGGCARHARGIQGQV